MAFWGGGCPGATAKRRSDPLPAVRSPTRRDSRQRRERERVSMLVGGYQLLAALAPLVSGLRAIPNDVSPSGARWRQCCAASCRRPRVPSPPLELCCCGIAVWRSHLGSLTARRKERQEGRKSIKTCDKKDAAEDEDEEDEIVTNSNKCVCPCVCMYVHECSWVHEIVRGCARAYAALLSCFSRSSDM